MERQYSERKMSAITGPNTRASEKQGTQVAIHPLFARSQFVGDIDWRKAFRRPAILATRLLDSPQALHWAYAFFYGVNTMAAIPAGLEQKLDTFTPLEKANKVPMQYACDKGIGQLSAGDLASVRQHLADLAHRCHFQVLDQSEMPGMVTYACTDPTEVNDRYSIISIGESLYSQALAKHSRTKEEDALVDLFVAVVMLHEVAHALGRFYMGDHDEDFFEASHVAEYGWELESRIFGLCPALDFDDLTEGSQWHTWQTLEELQGGYDLDCICRNVWRLPKASVPHFLDPQFAVKLASDEFWENEYLRDGAISLVPQVVQDLCLSGKENNTTRGIPQSIRDLFRGNAKSYAEKKYARYKNPGRDIRKPPTPVKVSDGAGDREESDEDAEWSDGHGEDACAYSNDTTDDETTDNDTTIDETTDDDSDDSDDDDDDSATVRGDEDAEMMDHETIESESTDFESTDDDNTVDENDDDDDDDDDDGDDSNNGNATVRGDEDAEMVNLESIDSESVEDNSTDDENTDDESTGNSGNVNADCGSSDDETSNGEDDDSTMHGDEDEDEEMTDYDR